MIKKVLVSTALVAALATVASAETHTYFGFHIGITNAPPPPRMVFYEEPDLYYEPTQRVYVVENDPYYCDMFRYGGSYYACHDGYWYRSSGYRGPFRVVDVRYVPRSIFNVPAKHWRRHYSSGNRTRYASYDRGDYGSRDRYRNRGDSRSWERDRNSRDRDRYRRDGWYPTRGGRDDRWARTRDGGRDDRWARTRDGGRDERSYRSRGGRDDGSYRNQDGDRGKHRGNGNGKGKGKGKHRGRGHGD